MHLAFSSMNTLNDPAPADLATALEQRGFESLWYGEHSHIPCSRKTPYPPGGEMPAPYRNMMDPYVSLMAAAAATTRLRLGTGIALLMERDIFSQAKTIASLDQLSGGRVLIGTGVGWNEEEFSNINPHPFNKRYAVMRETVAA
ncbi:MAG: LLM class flavin-dependent oxidoreductase, partial [Halieaceae bacterium]